MTINKHTPDEEPNGQRFMERLRKDPTISNQKFAGSNIIVERNCGDLDRAPELGGRRDEPSQDVTVGEFENIFREDRELGITRFYKITIAAIDGKRYEGIEDDDLIHDISLFAIRQGFSMLNVVNKEIKLIDWVRGVARNVARKHINTRNRHELILRKIATHECSESIEYEVNIVNNGKLESLKQAINTAVRFFPEPYRTIAFMKYVKCRASSDVVRVLRAMRPEAVGVHELRRLCRKTKEMIICAAVGGDPEKVWPRTFKKKNSWNDDGLQPRGT